MRPLRGQIRFGEGKDWMEIAGSGMVHPACWSCAASIPSAIRVTPLASASIARDAEIRHPDLRPFFESDLRWLKHYGFAALDIPTLHEGLSR